MKKPLHVSTERLETPNGPIFIVTETDGEGITTGIDIRKGEGDESDILLRIQYTKAEDGFLESVALGPTVIPPAIREKIGADARRAKTNADTDGKDDDLPLEDTPLSDEEKAERLLEDILSDICGEEYDRGDDEDWAEGDCDESDDADGEEDMEFDGDGADDGAKQGRRASRDSCQTCVFGQCASCPARSCDACPCDSCDNRNRRGFRFTRDKNPNAKPYYISVECEEYLPGFITKTLRAPDEFLPGLRALTFDSDQECRDFMHRAVHCIVNVLTDSHVRFVYSAEFINKREGINLRTAYFALKLVSAGPDTDKV